MATRITSTPRSTAIEIGGKPAGFLTSASLPRIDWPRAASMPASSRGAAAVIGPFAASAAIAGPGALLDWLLTLPRGTLAVTAGAMVEADFNFDVKRRVDWAGGLLSEVRWSTLDARDGKATFKADFKWQPTTIDFSAGGGKAPGSLGAKSKAWMASNFRISLGAGKIDSKFVSRVEMPSLLAKAAAATIGQNVGRGRRLATPGAVEISPLRVGFTGAGRTAALDFARAAMKNGVSPATDNIDVTIEMLDAALKRTLGTFQLGGCLLLSYEEPANDNQAEQLAETMLTFSVERFDLQV